jgi:hypothetical protein
MCLIQIPPIKFLSNGISLRLFRYLGERTWFCADKKFNQNVLLFQTYSYAHLGLEMALSSGAHNCLIMRCVRA